jgi:hypothetical protein
MKRFWFEFEIADYSKTPAGIGYGCGITANNYEDAISLISQKFFKSDSLPKIRTQIENVDVSTLDAGHVLPNMNPPNFRGIWFPQGYE